MMFIEVGRSDQKCCSYTYIGLHAILIIDIKRPRVSYVAKYFGCVCNLNNR